MQYLVAMHSRPCDQCHVNQVSPGTTGIQWVQSPTSPNELRHNPEQQDPTGFVPFLLPSLHLTEETESVTTCLCWSW